MLTTTATAPLILLVEDGDNHPELIRVSLADTPKTYRLEIAATRNIFLEHSPCSPRACGIIKSHEGAIHASSPPGCGTVITIYLPCVTPSAETAPL